MEGLEPNGVGGIVPFTGGIPNITYTGLEVPTNAASSIHQRRPQDTKGRIAKADNLEKPLKGFIFTGDMLDEFQKLSSKLAKSFKNNGSDSIIYAPIGNKMVNVLSSMVSLPPAKLEALGASHPASATYDSYCQGNDKLNKKKLLTSLSNGLRDRIALDDVEDTLAFLGIYAILLREFAPQSLTMYETIKSDIKNLHPSHWQPKFSPRNSPRIIVRGMMNGANIYIFPLISSAP